MITQFEPSLALIDIISILDSLKISHFLVGSFASGFRGEFRATNDIDIVIKLNENIIADFITASKANFFIDEISTPIRLKEERSINIIHEKTFVKIDFFTKITKFEEEQFNLASFLKIPTSKIKVKVSTAEYNIIAKLNWYLKSNQVLDRQITDVRKMILVNKNSLDLEYLRKWSDFFKTTDILNELLLELF
jgi:predicted nucleotidyltransferase